MAEGALTIRNTEVLFSTVLGFLSDENILKNGVTISKPLKKITIHFTGSAYKSSMPTRTMRSFIELQDAIYSIYSMYAYGDKKRLPAEIRHDLELDVIVREGSSWYDVPLEKIVSAVSERIKAMTGKELAGVTAAVCITFLASSLGSKVIDHRAEIERFRQTSSTLTGVQKNTAEAMIEAMEAQQSFYRLTSTQPFDSLEINGELFTKEDLREMVKVTRERHPIEQKIYSGNFKITDIHLGDETIYLDIVGAETGLAIKYVNLLKGIISENDYQWFKDSADGREVEMTIVATEKNGEIIASFLQSFSIPEN